MGCAAEFDQRREYGGPLERVSDLLGGARASGVARLVVQELVDRLLEGFDILGGNGDARTMAVDEIGERIAGCRDHGQSGPEVVEDPRAVRELRLDVIEVGADAEICFEEVVLTVR